MEYEPNNQNPENMRDGEAQQLESASAAPTAPVAPSAPTADAIPSTSAGLGGQMPLPTDAPNPPLQPMGTPPVAPPPVPPVQTPTVSGLAIAGLVLGILAILGAFVPILNIFTAPFAIIGLILAIVGFVGVNKGKHSGRGIAIAGIVLGAVALVVTVGMYGCAGAIAASNNDDAPSLSAQSEQADALSSPSASSVASSDSVTATTDASLVGIWDVTSLVSDDENLGEEDLQQVRDLGLDLYLELKDDGLLVYKYGDGQDTGSWEQIDGSSVGITIAGGTTIASLEGDTMTLAEADTTMTFRKRAPGADPSPSTASAPETTEAVSEEPAPEAPVSADGVSPEVKEALDSYEAVMDEYVAFMHKYQESGYSASMLSDYLSMLDKYNEFSAKIQAMDTENMTDADYSYYIEVTSRVAQKLREVL